MSKNSKLIGCGYCKLELVCIKHDPKVNKAKEGCKEYDPIILKNK